jgi:HNH endonuclease/NUMOD4 motif
MNEIWRPIPGHAGYQVSDRGRVRSLDRTITYMTKWGPVQRRLNGQELKPGPTTGGYPTVVLEGRTRYIHHCVLEAFVGPRPLRHEAAHGDGNPLNNTLSNLRWASHSANEADKRRHGTKLSGARTPNGRKTHCRQGHPYDATNTTRLRRGSRVCRTCTRAWKREWKRRWSEARRAERARRSGTRG